MSSAPPVSTVIGWRSAVAAYSVAHFGKMLIWNFFQTFFLFFAIYGLGLEPIYASLFVFLFAVMDVGVDVPASFIINRMQKKWGGMSRWVTFGAPATAVLLLMSFYSGSPDDSNLWVVICIIAGFASRVAFTFVDVPMNASVGRVSNHSRRRNLVAGSRNIASAAAKGSLAGLLAIQVEQDGEIVAGNLWVAAAVIALIAPLAIVPAFRRVDQRAHQSEVLSGQKQSLNFADFLPGLTRNMLYLSAANIAFLLLACQFGHALIFMVETDPLISTPFSSVWAILTVVSAITVGPWMWFASRNEKRTIAFIGLVAISIVVALYPTLKSSTWGIVTFVVLFAGVGHVNSIIWSMLPDATDEASLAVGRPIHAPVVGSFAAVGKLTIGLSQLLGGAFLQWSGFPESPDFRTYQTLVIVATVSGCLMVLLLLAKYRLNHDRHAEVVRKLFPVGQGESDGGVSP